MPSATHGPCEFGIFSFRFFRLSQERPLELEASDDEGNAESDAEPGDPQQPAEDSAEHPPASMPLDSHIISLWEPK